MSRRQRVYKLSIYGGNLAAAESLKPTADEAAQLHRYITLTNTMGNPLTLSLSFELVNIK